jgi:hypothetical protein
LPRSENDADYWERAFGPDLFGVRVAPPTPPFLEGVLQSDLSTWQLPHFFQRMDMGALFDGASDRYQAIELAGGVDAVSFAFDVKGPVLVEVAVGVQGS